MADRTKIGLCSGEAFTVDETPEKVKRKMERKGRLVEVKMGDRSLTVVSGAIEYLLPVPPALPHPPARAGTRSKARKPRTKESLAHFEP